MILREEGPYFTCMRCEHKAPIAGAVWDNGILICNLYCTPDKAVFGSVELRQAREVAIDKKEFQPEPKLINPTDPASQLENLPASSGTFD